MSATRPTRPTLAERFNVFDERHGTTESPLKDRILTAFIERALNEHEHYSRSEPVGAYVADRFKSWAPEILMVLELAADWSADPTKAAARQLRSELEAKVKADEEARQRREDQAIASAVKEKADAFLQGLKESTADAALVK